MKQHRSSNLFFKHCCVYARIFARHLNHIFSNVIMIPIVLFTFLRSLYVIVIYLPRSLLGQRRDRMRTTVGKWIGLKGQRSYQ